jgi:predicted AAA+ superfamily ATPase
LAHYHEYLIRGGFPQTAMIASITQAQRLLREDIIDKVLKRDMTALFGVRNVLDLERTFLYLCMHDGALLDMKALCENLEVKRPTAQNYIRYLEDAHLIYRLEPHGYGKDVLRGQFKVYLADAAIAPSVMMQGMELLEDPDALGIATESAVFRHLFAHYYAQNVRFSYWRGKKEMEVDVLADIAGQIVPFEIKYRNQNTDVRYLKGLIELCQKKKIKRGYVVTKSLNDFGMLTGLPNGIDTELFKVPAALLCYWMGAMEVDAPA